MTKAASLYIDVLRLVAALVVFAVHAHYLLPKPMPGLWRLAALGGEAVTVFFVLSGLVIAHVVHTRETRAADYLASRFARLYSVVLPGLALTATLDIAGKLLAPADYAFTIGQDSRALLASLLFVNELWWTSAAPPSNTPFWSLGYEFWYYLLYAALRYLPDRRVRWATLLTLGAACGPKILLLLPVWQLGVAAYAIAGRHRLRPGMAVFHAVVSAAGLYLLVASGAKAEWHNATVAALGPLAQGLGPSSHVLYTYAFGVLTTLHLIAMVTLVPLFGKLWRSGERAIRATSAQTFAIYLFHYPLLKFLVAVTGSIGVLRGPVVIAVTLATIAALGSAGDRLKPALRRWFLARLGKSIPEGYRATAGVGLTNPSDAIGRR
ncbi:acyltransferase family protein [Pseudoduganella plicata]|uniref:Acyltransferase n=1 Tax=Pseudoduganella plicata TaxID=321984 RepID=A0A4P7BBB7_9BURK|nr:acyltransferase [Pseudoduganella plicata]QBQ35764.1 acyltransferase [Pseudoduganella plicata]GGY95248.1 acyltransferase [Pseudoduganella plicata]